MRELELTPQARAAKVAWLLAKHGELTTREIISITGLSPMGVYYLMLNLSLADIPYYKPEAGIYRIADGREDVGDL